MCSGLAGLFPAGLLHALLEGFMVALFLELRDGLDLGIEGLNRVSDPLCVVLDVLGPLIDVAAELARAISVEVVDSMFPLNPPDFADGLGQKFRKRL